MACESKGVLFEQAKTIKALLLFIRRSSPPAASNQVRLTLGRCLAVGLTFELPADILRTAVTPWWNHIEQMAAIAAPRTGLNYFLEREIRQESIREGHPPQSVV